MAGFTFTTLAANSTNTANTATVSIAVSPETAIISATNLLPGQSAQGTVNVSNAGDVDLYYYVSADWKEGGTTTARMATILANQLSVSVDAGSPATTLYAGSLAGLVDRPDSPGRQLTLTTANENVTFVVTLPSDTGNLAQGLSLSMDFVFVAQQ